MADGLKRMPSKCSAWPSLDGEVARPQRTTSVNDQEALQRLAGATATTASSFGDTNGELPYHFNHPRAMRQRDKRFSSAAWNEEEQQSVLRNLRNSFVLPYAAFRRTPLGEWRVVHWSALRGADFLIPIGCENYAESTEPLKISPNSMKGRISSLVGERIPLEILTHRSLKPAQLAEIQVLLTSKSVVNLAFAFCHLVHWVTFGQTRPDRAEGSRATWKEDTSYAPAFNDSTVCTSNSAAMPPAGGLSGVSKKLEKNLKFGSGLFREQKVLEKGQSIPRRAMPAVSANHRISTHKKAFLQGPKQFLRDELRRLRRECSTREKEFGRGITNIANGNNAVQTVPAKAVRRGMEGEDDCGGLKIPLDSCTRRLKALAVAENAYKQTTEHIKSTFGIFGVSLVCPLLVLAVKEAAAWALTSHFPRLLGQKHRRLFIFRFPTMDSHPVTQRLQRKLDKYLANCPKPPVTAFEWFHMLCTPLDLTRCTKLLELQVQQLKAQVIQQTTFLQLSRGGQAVPPSPVLVKEDPQFKLLRLQKEHQELLARKNQKSFEPEPCKDCPRSPRGAALVHSP
ncbi:hypothetical protein cyc_07517 [Cyclospora cayetanensis]|uniref:Uncharacterized protein n=1 Tax=Cyclospora cayetanensis TaxID=88456 RepID=A0A1D3CZB7_9EIME|nr:hypothetical protein cyc_07517 [Cyclospora cayetanensis]